MFLFLRRKSYTQVDFLFPVDYILIMSSKSSGVGKKIMVLDKLKRIADKTYCQLRPSPVQGVGVFAIRDIAKGKEPFRDALDWHKKSYARISLRELETLPSYFVPLVKNYAVGDGKSYWVSLDSWNKYGIDDFLNHSSTPNIGAKGDYCFVALRDIQDGEELTIDYRNIDDAWREKLGKMRYHGARA